MHDKAELERLVAPELARRGLELVRLTVSGSPRQPSIMVYVDRVGGVTVGECVEVAKALRPVLARHFGLGRSFTLGASSPGTDRPLQTQKDFALVVGRLVTLRVRAQATDEVIDVVGMVLGAEADGVILGTEDPLGRRKVPYEKIAAATMKLPYG